MEHIRDFKKETAELSKDELVVLHNTIASKIGVQPIQPNDQQGCLEDNRGKCGKCVNGVFTPCQPQ